MTPVQYQEALLLKVENAYQLAKLGHKTSVTVDITGLGDLPAKFRMGPTHRALQRFYHAEVKTSRKGEITLDWTHNYKPKR